MRRIGYTVKGKEEQMRLLTEGQCHNIVRPAAEEDPAFSFHQFLTEHPMDELVVINLGSVNLSLSQLAPLLEIIEEQRMTLRFLDQPWLTDGDYVSLLLDLSRQEQRLMSIRTRQGLERAKQLGHVGGRPPLNSETIVAIRQLYFEQRFTLREIVNRSGVSLGNVHKYVHLTQEEVNRLVTGKQKESL